MASLSPCSSLTTASMLSRKQKFSVPSLKTNLNFLSRSISSVRLDSPKQPFFVPKFSQTDAPSLAEPEIEPTTEIEAITEVQPTVETSEAETKREEVFAVVMVGSRQYIVFPGRFIYTQRLKGANVNDKITLNKVLLVGTKTSTYIGKPIVPNATVHAIVEEQVRYSSGGVFLYLIFLFCALLL
ncbi:50S ribosomal L21, chloroplastic [Olea europaea subsp. europaea]|uniref:50S ribosomal L21, chloroplastic n=1 Tax=Olea europaea subsp. europaea TaxID=158383 RepID=A0A8S0S8Q6_OLEEU|nr:50S ribosomal L21, chloroplastic [Olea europaea subsp. europaea]